MKTILYASAMILIIVTLSCISKTDGAWLKGDEAEKTALLEKHFRGFDMAMAETGYRYQELYWAGMDENWEYAQYQLLKMKLAIENGFERRPARKKTAVYFTEEIIPSMQSVIAQEDTALFSETFKIMTIQCNNCHKAENVDFFNVSIPEFRNSIIKKGTE
jgi:hypothetical protein